jgi:P4 family phage/plasmid primase-like protien
MTDERETIARRLAEADVVPERFIMVEQGGKASFDHEHRTHENVAGNYGVHTTADDSLVWLDIDDYGDVEDKSGLSALAELPTTLEQTTPHGGRHRLFVVRGGEDGRAIADVLTEEFGSANLQPSWGEVRVANQYVVGAGSQLDGCKKDWCEECATDEGGRYVLEHDRVIATITPRALVDVLREDPTYTESGGCEPPAIGESNIGDEEQRLEFALDNDDKLRRLYDGRTAEYDGDRSKAESALAMKLGYWFEGDKRIVRRLMDRSAAEKWAARDDDAYRESVLEGVDKLTEFFRPGESERDTIPALNEVAEGDEAPVGGGWQAVAQAYADPETSKRVARDRAVGQLRDDHHFATFRDTGDLYAYDPTAGIYRPNGETVVREAVEANLGGFYSQNEAAEILHRVKSGSYRDREAFGADADDPKVCVANGVVSLPDGEFTDHSPEHLFLSHAPIEYDPDAECSGFDSFLGDVLESEDDRQLAYEVFGYCLFPAYPFAKALFMYGDGRNGKSTLLDVLKRFLGRENISSRGLIELSSDDFAAADLYGAYANICGDLPNKAVEHTGTFKKLTGGDLVTANPKHETPFPFENRAKLVFSANDPPQISDDSTAMYRRLLLLNFPNEFTPPGQPGPDARKKGALMDDIASDTELSGILNRALVALQRVFDERAFSQDGSVEQVRERYKKVSDPMFAFTNECVQEDADGEVEKGRLFDVYREWSRESGAPAKSKSVFSRELYKRTKASDSRVRRGGERLRVYQGVSLTGRGEELAEDDDDLGEGQGKL